MGRLARRNSGFSLIELLIAMFIIMVSMLALLTSMLVSMRTNADNELRNASIRLSNQTAEALLALPFADPELATGITHSRSLSSDNQDDAGLPVPRQKIRSFEQDFDIRWSVSLLTQDVKQIDIRVQYLNRGRTLSHSTAVYKHKAI